MKRKLLITALALLMLFVGAALAEDEILKVEVDLSNNRFTEPAEVSVTVRVTNISDAVLPGPVTLFYPDNKPVEEFGAPVLDPGMSRSWTGTWFVTQDQLDKGKVAFIVRFTDLDADGSPRARALAYARQVFLQEAVPSIELSRTIAPTTAGKGQQVSVTYEIRNTGAVDLEKVTITENEAVSDTPAAIGTIPAGERRSHTFTFKMGESDVNSAATITYTAGGVPYTEQKEAATIRFGVVKLSAVLSADKKGGLVGDTATLTLSLKNTGDTAVEGIAVTDALLGDVAADLAVPAGETVTHTVTVPIQTTSEYQFFVTGRDADGIQIDTATERLTVTAVEPSQDVNLSVALSADRDTVYEQPGLVYFTVAVTNLSAAEAKDVTIRADGNALTTFPSILPGETRTYTRDLAVSMRGTYQFSATVKDALGATRSFESNTVRIAVANPTPEPAHTPIIGPVKPTAIPRPTEPVLVTPAPVAGRTGLGTMGWLGIVLLVPALAGLVLVIIGLISRMKKAADSRSALDHMEKVNIRDYSKEGGDESDEPADEPEEKPFRPNDGQTDAEFEAAVEAAARRRRQGSAPAPSDSEPKK